MITRAHQLPGISCTRHLRTSSLLHQQRSLETGCGVCGASRRLQNNRNRVGRCLAGDFGDYKLNVNLAVDKEHEVLSLGDMAELPVDALQGVAERGAAALAKIGVKSVKDLANSKYYKWAKAITVLAQREEDGKRAGEAVVNIDSAVVKQFEKCSLKEIAAAPVWALQGISEGMAEDLSAVQIRTVKDFAENKYAAWAEAIVTLASTGRA